MGAVAAIANDESERVDQFYRFSVKCDRRRNTQIEAAARKEGLSVTAFVQRHFETILDGASTAKAPPPPFDARAFSERHGVSLSAATMWAAYRAKADDNGIVQVGARQMAAKAGLRLADPNRHVAALVQAGLLEMRKPAGGPAPPVYRVVEEG